MAEENPTIKAVQKTLTDVPVICEEPIPTIFADGVQGIALINNSVRMNFFEDKFNPITGELKRYITARVALPVDVFYSFADIAKQVKDSAQNLVAVKVEPNKGGHDG